jgi:hypothetical protein
MVDVDVVETDRLVTNARFAQRRIGHLDLFPHITSGPPGDGYEWQKAWQSPFLA